MKRAIIIGGGIAGLSAAYYLKKQGVDVTLLEQGSSVGGSIKTVLKNKSYLLELGPNTFLSRSDSIFKLSEYLGLKNKIISNTESSKKRYVFRKGALQCLPTGPKEFIMSPILSLRGRLRVLLEPLISSKSKDNESLASFVTRRAGKELLDYLVDPFVSGVYAGDPYQLEIKSVFPKLVEIEARFGSVFKGMKELKGEIKTGGLMSFFWGMETLPAAINDALRGSILTDSSVESVEKFPGKRWAVRYTKNPKQGLSHIETGYSTVEADAVIIATHANEAARLLVPHSPDIFAPLMGIGYVSMAVVHVAYRQKDIPIPMDGFGFLIPRSEKIRMLGSVWSSSLFSNRAPRGETLLTNYIGGATDPNAIELDDHELITHIRNGLERTMGIKAEPTFCNIKRIGQAIPQYTVGHSSRLEEIAICTDKLPGIFLTGSYFTGISVADTITHSKIVAGVVRSFLPAN